MPENNTTGSASKKTFGFKNFFWSKKNQPSGPTTFFGEPPVNASGEKINDQIERSAEVLGRDLLLDLEQDNVQININNHIDNEVKIYRRYGEIDGTNGSRDYNIDTIALSHAAHLAESIVSKIAGKLAGLARQVADKTKDVNASEKDYSDAKSTYEDALDFSQREPKSFHRFTAVLYFIFAVALILADIPVSLSLVGFLNIGHTPGTAHLITKLDDPELVLFACGIAFCTVYIKLLYDEYINTRLGTPLFNIRKVPPPGSTTVRNLRVEYFIKLAVKLLILGGLLYMLINLGHFRNGYSNIAGDADDVIKREPHIADYRFGSFLGITIMIPVIGGICLSLAFTIFNNHHWLKKTKDNMDRYQSDLEKKRDALQRFIIKQAQLNVYLDEWKKLDHKESLLSDQFIGGYEQAYKRAYQKAFGYDFFNIVEEFQREAMFKSIKKTINPLKAKQ